MNDLQYEYARENDTIGIKLSGFTFAHKLLPIRDAILSELKALQGYPFKVLLDFRGLKALHPQAAEAIGEIYDYLSASSATKIGTVFGDPLAKMQHLRLARKRKEADSGRSRILDDIDACRAWFRE